MSRIAIAALAAVPSTALADEGGDEPVEPLLPVMGAFGGPTPLGVLRGHFAPAAHAAGHGFGGGVLLGVDAGWAGLLGTTRDPFQGSVTFGVRAGYQLSNGLGVALRYDHLGVEPWPGRATSTPVRVGTLAVRYAFPFIVPMPFVEALVGPSFHGGTVSPGGGLGLGGSVPLGRHVTIDLVGRDWLFSIDREVRQVFTVELGLGVILASPGS